MDTEPRLASQRAPRSAVTASICRSRTAASSRSRSRTARRSGNASSEARRAPCLALDDRIFVGSRDKFFYCLNDEERQTALALAHRRDHRRYGCRRSRNASTSLRSTTLSGRWTGKWIAALEGGTPLRPPSAPLLLGSVLFVGGVAGTACVHRPGRIDWPVIRRAVGSRVATAAAGRRTFRV